MQPIKRIEPLLGVIQALSQTRALSEIQDLVRHAARELSRADGATFVLEDGDQCYYADEDAISPLWKGHRFPMSQCVSGWVMREGKALQIPDVYADPRVPIDAYRPTFVKSMAMVPIRRDSPIGAIGIYWANRHEADPEDLRLLQALADSTSIAIENVGLYSALEARLQDLTTAFSATQTAHAHLDEELTHRRRAEAQLQATEDQLRQSQKMEAVGQLAGGIAHDFNNVLSVILGYSEMLALDLEEGSPLRADIQEIHQAGLRAASLTRQLLAFSRQQVLDPRLCDVSVIIAGLDRMLHRLIGEDIELVLDLAADLRPVLADPGQIEQVVINLAVNARDAMPQGGTLAISTRNGASAHPAEGPLVQIIVTDTGTGMDADTQARIFEPFFTTKPRGKGTGLGLSTVHSIADQSGGRVRVTSELGQGTTFTVDLPAVEGQIPVSSDGSAAGARVTGTETIIVVEDDHQVRIITSGILRRAGYNVIDASNPELALLTAGRTSAPIHLLVTDIVMPQMSGVQLALKLRDSRPDLKVLCMSGYTDETTLRHGIEELALSYLQKPVTPGRLLMRVRQLLDGTS